ncbi:MAG: flagellar hook-length control protein FliK [Lachnospiraceae bacterium]|nr:flagellar hook-length control protein FliK [Lachnospiraceae bacterium]MBQ7781854.1 flagellar hook-length control protein FliK [Lachnospiraceae bacterium]
MKLSDIFTGVSKQTNPNKEVQETERQNSSAERVNKQIKALTPGKVVQGEVISKNGNEVQLKLSEDVTLTARLDKDINVETGKVLTFEVKNNGSSLSLSPLFANTATADNVFKALQMASLPVNNTTVSMTETMMLQGMSINSNSLQNMFKEVMANPGADAASVVQLRYMGMPVNEANLSQMESYKALTHQLVRGMTDVLQEIPGVFNEIVQTAGTDKAVQMYQELLQNLLPEGTSAGILGSKAESFMQMGEGAANITESAGMQNVVLTPEGDVIVNPAGVLENTVGIVAEGNVLAQGLDSNQVQQQESMSGEVQQTTQFADNSVAMVLTTKERAEFSTLLKAVSAEVSPEIAKLVQEVQNATADINEVLRALSGMSGEAGRTEALAELFKSPICQKLFENAMLKEWSIKPEQVADAENVKEMYSRLEKSLENIRSVLENNGANQSVAMKSVTNMSQNLDFMNQMNQMYTYVQLPLQMQEGRTNGELYVYTNKRSLAQNDGNISAFLHLDMEHLGPVDVYVAMQNERVSTHFTLADDEMLDFLNAHMHILTERLEKKGYSMSVEMKVKDSGEEDITPIERIMQADKNTTVLKQYAFDVRA